MKSQQSPQQRSSTGDQQQQQPQQFSPLQISHALAVNPHWTMESLLAQGSATSSAPPPIPQAPPPLPNQILTIYMQDYRSGGESPDHLLSELPVPLHKDQNDQWWVNADDMVRRLQATPGRIDGSAKLSIKRGIYRQLFCRVSATSIEKCNPESLRIAPDHSIEVVIEHNTPLNPSNSPTSVTPISQTGHKRQHTEPDAGTPISGPRLTKRTKSNGGGSTDDASPVVSPMTGHSIASSFPSQNGIYDATTQQHQPYLPMQSPAVIAPVRSSSLIATPTSAQHPPTPSTSSIPPARKPVVTSGKGVNVKNEIARAAIIPWLQGVMQQEEGYEYFVKTKGRILSISDTLRAYRFARMMLQKYNNTQTPADLEGAANRKITKVNIWQALDRQTSWGSDAETTLTLVDKYGPGGPEEHTKIVDMINGKFAPDEREGSVLFLNHLKRIDAEAKAAKEAAAQAALNAMIAQ